MTRKSLGRAKGGDRKMSKNDRYNRKKGEEKKGKAGKSHLI